MNYIRDGRAPIPDSEVTSRVMRSNKGKDTKPEILLRSALREIEIPGYRLHWKQAPGRPDISYPGKKIAIFVHGCFWHRCPHCNLSLPKSNIEFWSEKFRKNVERDSKKKKALENEGWDVLVIWECKIKENVYACAQRIKDLYLQKGGKEHHSRHSTK